MGTECSLRIPYLFVEIARCIQEGSTSFQELQIFDIYSSLALSQAEPNIPHFYTLIGILKQNNFKKITLRSMKITLYASFMLDKILGTAVIKCYQKHIYNVKLKCLGHN